MHELTMGPRFTVSNLYNRHLWLNAAIIVANADLHNNQLADMPFWFCLEGIPQKKTSSNCRQEYSHLEKKTNIYFPILPDWNPTQFVGHERLQYNFFSNLQKLGGGIDPGSDKGRGDLNVARDAVLRSAIEERTYVRDLPTEETLHVAKRIHGRGGLLSPWRNWSCHRSSPY